MIWNRIISVWINIFFKIKTTTRKQCVKCWNMWKIPKKFMSLNILYAVDIHWKNLIEVLEHFLLRIKKDNKVSFTSIFWKSYFWQIILFFWKYFFISLYIFVELLFFNLCYSQFNDFSKNLIFHSCFNFELLSQYVFLIGIWRVQFFA